MVKRPYYVVGLGGTFDHFHAGHAHFLKFASQLGAELRIGVTAPHLISQKNYPQTLEDWWTRATAVKHFCGQHHYEYKVMRLDDPFGPTLEKSPIQALVVTEETADGGEKINELRVKLGMRPLPIHICPMLADESGQILHADRIRAGQVNRRGQVYATIFDQDLVLDDTQRAFVSKPQGEIIAIDQLDEVPGKNGLPVCVVGDSSLETFIERKWKYTLGVFDHKKQRQVVQSYIIDALKPNATVTNEAGMISKELVNRLQQMLTTRQKHLLVEGEEDLATVALFLLLPLGAHIFYGQPKKGIVCVEVTEKLKNAIYSLLCNP